LYFCTLMRKWTRFFIFPVILALLLSMQGISVFKHHCKNSGNTYMSLFSPTNCAHHSTQTDDCHSCTTDQDHCCKIIQSESCSDNCCTDSHIYLKPEILGLQITYHTLEVSKLLFLSIHTLYFQEYRQTDPFQKIFYHQPKPPPKTGTLLVIIYQSLKIPTFLS